MRLAARTILATLAALAMAVALAPAPAGSAASTPTTPTDLRVLDIGPDFAVIAFTGSANDANIKWYTVNTYNRTMVTTTPSSTVFGGLRAGRSYTLTVSAVDKANNVSAPSTPITFTTDPPPAVSNLQVTSASGGTVSLSWGRPAGVEPYRYLVYDGGQPEAVTNIERVTMKNLAPGTHSFTVIGWLTSGATTPHGAPATVTVASRGTDLTPPSPPGNPVSVEDPATYEFDITWEASTDPVDPSSSLTYDLLQAWPGGPFTATYSVSGTAFHGGFVSAVRAVDPAGNRSTIATATQR